jgi:hypothetical protein
VEISPGAHRVRERMARNGGGALMGLARDMVQGGYMESGQSRTPPSSTAFDQCGLLPISNHGVQHTRKSKAWAVWVRQSWKKLDRVAIKAGR